MKTILSFFNRYTDHFFFYLGIGTVLSNYVVIVNKLVMDGSLDHLTKSYFTSPDILMLQGGEMVVLSLFAFIIDGRLKSFTRNLLVLAILSPFLAAAQWPWVGGHFLILPLVGLVPMVILLVIWLMVKNRGDNTTYVEAGPRWLGYMSWFFRGATALIYYSFIYVEDFTTAAIPVTAGFLLLVSLLSAALYYRYSISVERIGDGFIGLGVLVILIGYAAGGFDQSESTVITGAGLVFILTGSGVKYWWRKRSSKSKTG